MAKGKDQIRGTHGDRQVLPGQWTAENLMNLELSASRPDEKWCTDVTEFKYDAGKKAYLSDHRPL